MFNKFKNIVKRFGVDQKEINPSRFNDPIAIETAWTPLKGGGASFKTHKLVAKHTDRIEFKASVTAIIFFLVFIIFGIIILVVFLFNFKGEIGFKSEIIIPVLVAGCFSGLGVFMFYYFTTPIIFDRNTGYFWRGRKTPKEAYNIDQIKDIANFKDIHAIQLISEYCSGNKSSYYSYELNLVLKNAKRINVIDHGNEVEMRNDANTLSAFINVPIWDAI